MIHQKWKHDLRTKDDESNDERHTKVLMETCFVLPDICQQHLKTDLDTRAISKMLQYFFVFNFFFGRTPSFPSPKGFI